MSVSFKKPFSRFPVPTLLAKFVCYFIFYRQINQIVRLLFVIFAISNPSPSDVLKDVNIESCEKAVHLQDYITLKSKIIQSETEKY